MLKQGTNPLCRNSFGKIKTLLLLNIKKKKIVELYYSSIQNANLSLPVATQIVEKKHSSVPSINKFLPKPATVNCLYRYKNNQ